VRRLGYFPKSIAAENGFITFCEFGETEVEDLGVTALGDKNIDRVDIAMNDAVGMSGIEGIGNFYG